MGEVLPASVIDLLHRLWLEGRFPRRYPRE